MVIEGSFIAGKNKYTLTVWSQLQKLGLRLLCKGQEQNNNWEEYASHTIYHTPERSCELLPVMSLDD